MTAAPAYYERLAEAAGEKWKVDPRLILAIMVRESSFNSRALSPTGAMGLMQLEPGTARELGVTDPYDPAQNVEGGARYLRGLLDRYHGNTTYASAAYNAGPGAVDKYGGIPPYAETQNYVRNVAQSYAQYGGQPMPFQVQGQKYNEQYEPRHITGSIAPLTPQEPPKAPDWVKTANWLQSFGHEHITPELLNQTSTALRDHPWHTPSGNYHGL